jgi:predicted enzyme related to lactoylglutathione lyase
MNYLVRSLFMVLLSVCCSVQAFAQEKSGAEEMAKTTGNNPVVFWELASNDADKSVKFFRNVFDWDIKFDDRLGFYTVSTGAPAQKIDGYIFTMSKPRLPFLTVYILVENIEKMAEKVEEYGGLVVQPPKVVVKDGPKICLFNDPSGETFAMIEPRKAE